MGKGLLFDVENPYEASTKVTADAARTMAAQTKRQETKTKEKTTLGDVVNTGLALGLGVSMLKDMGGGAAMAQANQQTANVDKMIAAKAGTPAATGNMKTAPVSMDVAGPAPDATGLTPDQGLPDASGLVPGAKTNVTSGISGEATKGLQENTERMFDSMGSTYDMFAMGGGGF